MHCNGKRRLIRRCVVNHAPASVGSVPSLVRQVTGKDSALFIVLGGAPWLTPVAWTPQLIRNIQQRRLNRYFFRL
jgi:hypothetical protein